MDSLPSSASSSASLADPAPVTSTRFDVDLRRRPTLPTAVDARLRAEAQAAGYAAGWAQGRREAAHTAASDRELTTAGTRQAAAEQAARIQQALTALTAAAAELEQRMLPTVAELEDLIVNTAFVIAEHIVGRELTTAVEPGHDAIVRALALAPTNRPVTVRLHPSDYATVTGGQSETVTMDGRTVTLRADPSLQPGDAVAECDATTVDARIQPALNRVREVLGL